MKRIFTLLTITAFVAMSTQLFAQSPRMTFVEEATQASCPPCASANPPLQALLNQNHDEAIFVAYQVWWPGYDAMYLDNTAEVDARIGNYYVDGQGEMLIGGAPNIIVQGNSGAQGTTYLTQQVIDNTYAEMSEFDLTLNAEIVNGQLNISGMAEATAAASGDLTLRLIITEETIYGEDLVQEGTNGETEFHHVFKGFVGGVDGVDIADTWAIGDTYMIDETFNLSTLNIYDYSSLEVVAIIQNDDNFFVHQAAKAADLPITVEFNNTASAAGVDDIPAQCSGTITVEPLVTVSNTGNLDLTSATIVYNVNGGADQTYNWTGSLTTYQSENVTLPGYTFDTDATNTLNVTISEANGGVDEFLDDNSVTADIALSPEAESIILELTTDTYADEIYWEVQNSNGEAIASGGNPNVGLTNTGTGTFPPPVSAESYANSTSYSIGIDIPAVDCYTLYFVDFYGDGVATYGGSYFVTDVDGNLLIDGTEFAGAEDINSYKGTAVSINVEEETAKAGFTVLTNPVIDQLELIVDLNEAAQTSLTVVDFQGRTVINEAFGTLGAGQYNQSYDVSALASGMYFVTLTTENEVINKKVIIGK
ncbi:MAG: T9SS type A sorting domain-containing protein [Flavobacteriales bacterium]